MTIRTIQMELLRPEEIIAERERCPLIYVPIGPLEWHSHHLPYGTDALNAEAVARAVALHTGGIVHPTIFSGTERERPADKLRSVGLDENSYVVGMDYPGNSLPSLYAREEIFGLLIKELLDQLIALKYKLIVLVNGHGARNHLEVLKRLSTEYSSRSPARVLLTFALPQNALGVAGHAEAVETSLMLHLHPDSVRLDALPPLPEPIRTNIGIVDSATFNGNPTPDRTLPPESDPRLHASSTRGRDLIDQTVTEVISLVMAALESYKIAIIPT